MVAVVRCVGGYGAVVVVEVAGYGCGAAVELLLFRAFSLGLDLTQLVFYA